MKISTSFATFFAAPVEGAKVALFAHQPHNLSRLFEFVGLRAAIVCLYSDRFKCDVAVATLEEDDFTLLRWEIEDRNFGGFCIGNFRIPGAVAPKPVPPQLELRHTMAELQEFADCLNLDRIEREETEKHHWSGGFYLGYGRDEQTLAIRSFVSTSGILLTLPPRERGKIACLPYRQNWRTIEDLTSLRFLLRHCYETGQDVLTNQITVHLLKKIGVEIRNRKDFFGRFDENDGSENRHGVWDNACKNLGFMARDNGAFGSLCLSDCYGDESTGQERCYYDD